MRLNGKSMEASVSLLHLSAFRVRLPDNRAASFSSLPLFVILSAVFSALALHMIAASCFCIFSHEYNFCTHPNTTARTGYAGKGRIMREYWQICQLSCQQARVVAASKTTDILGYFRYAVNLVVYLDSGQFRASPVDFADKRLC